VRRPAIWRALVLATLFVAATLAPLGPAGLVPAAHACGVERWSVKTLGDADAGRVNLEPLASTVPELAAYPAPSSSELRQHAASRIESIGDPPIELSAYTLNIVLVEFKLETDQDIHLARICQCLTAASRARAIKPRPGATLSEWQRSTRRTTRLRPAHPAGAGQPDPLSPPAVIRR
jgi:hypothetical protein